MFFIKTLTGSNLFKCQIPHVFAFGCCRRSAFVNVISDSVFCSRCSYFLLHQNQTRRREIPSKNQLISQKGLFVTASASKYMFKLYQSEPPCIPPCWILFRSQFLWVETHASRSFTWELTRNHVHFSDEPLGL